MEYIEITGKTVDEAITNATIKLSVTSDKLEYEVVDKGSNGFLGINRRPAVIKVRIADAQDEFEQVVKEAVAAPKQESKPFKKPEVKKVDTQAPKNEFKRASENVKPVNTEKPLQVKSTPAQKPEENMDKTSKRPVAGDNMEPAIKKFLGDVLKAMEERRSIRKYKADMVPQEILDQIIEAGLYAASGKGTQNTIIIQVTKKELRDKNILFE